MRQKTLLALTSGILLALSWPTYGFPLLIFIAFIPLLWAERQLRLDDTDRFAGRKAFTLAYLAFLVWNLVSTWWIWYASPFGMVFAVLVNTLLMALVFLVYHKVARKLPPRIHYVFLPAFWIAFEKMHLHWDFSWPWLNLGNAFANWPWLIQWYEYTGSLGGSAWIWIINLLLFHWLSGYRRSGIQPRTLLLTLLLLAIPALISVIMFTQPERYKEKAEVIVVQPNIDPYTEKYQRNNTEFARELILQARDTIGPGTRYLITPETYLSQNSSIDGFEQSPEKQMLQQLAASHPGLNILTGADFYRYYPQTDKPTPTANPYRNGGWFDVYNAAVQVNNTGNTQKYIKSRLVVGVEHFPYKNLLEPLLGNIMIDLGGTVASRATQEDRTVFTTGEPSLSAGPIICYESVYGEFVTGYVKNGASLLAIITNDAWWQDTEGHRQHLAYARIRAIETRRSIARSANTGISALIDPRGKLLQTLPYNTKGLLKGELPVEHGLTFYVRHGDFLARICILLSGLILLYSLARKKGRTA